MKTPKMIVFDYGHTLLYEPGWDSNRGRMELLKYMTKKPNNYTIEDIRQAVGLIFGEHVENARKIGYDISGQICNRTLFEYLGIEFSLTPNEMEKVFWHGASAGAVMPGVDKMLGYLHKKGIRSGVISNLLWSGDALTERLNRLLPNNQFEFVMTSGDYFLRKPNRILFDIALQKAKLSASDVWYCGDSVRADIEGASQAGIYPVWYDNETEKDYRGYSETETPKCEHLHIYEWDELIFTLEELAGKLVV